MVRAGPQSSTGVLLKTAIAGRGHLLGQHRFDRLFDPSRGAHVALLRRGKSAAPIFRRRQLNVQLYEHQFQREPALDREVELDRSLTTPAECPSQILWLLPIYIVSFLLNGDWYQDIAAYAHAAKMSTEETSKPSKRMRYPLHLQPGRSIHIH